MKKMIKQNFLQEMVWNGEKIGQITFLIYLLYLIFDSLQCCKVLFFLAVSPPKDQHTPSVAVIETLYSHWHLMGTDTQISINKYLQTKWKDAAPVLRYFLRWLLGFMLLTSIALWPPFLYLYLYMCFSIDLYMFSIYLVYTFLRKFSLLTFSP